jgi:hypothetical protein
MEVKHKVENRISTTALLPGAKRPNVPSIAALKVFMMAAT